MAVKVTLGEVETRNEKPFPKLMKQLDTGWVLYMIDETTAVHLTGGFKGHFSTKYVIDKHTVDFNSPVILQNA